MYASRISRTGRKRGHDATDIAKARVRDAFRMGEAAFYALGWHDLPSEHRAVLTLMYRDDLFAREAAVKLGISQSTVKRYVRTAAEVIVQALQDDPLVQELGVLPVNDVIRREPIPFSLRVAVYQRDGFACCHCGTRSRLSLDHIFPYSKGGAATYENLQTLCVSCNSRKRDRVDCSAARLLT